MLEKDWVKLVTRSSLIDNLRFFFQLLSGSRDSKKAMKINVRKKKVNFILYT